MEGGGTQEIAFHNIGGQAGPAGKTGAPSIAAPTDGFDGTNGEIQIYIEKPDATTAGPYASPYNLEVVEFEIVDSNEDGILEFGEEVTLRNIGVRNSGSFGPPTQSLTKRRYAFSEGFCSYDRSRPHRMVDRS